MFGCVVCQAEPERSGYAFFFSYYCFCYCHHYCNGTNGDDLLLLSQLLLLQLVAFYVLEELKVSVLVVAFV